MLVHAACSEDDFTTPFLHTQNLHSSPDSEGSCHLVDVVKLMNFFKSCLVSDVKLECTKEIMANNIISLTPTMAYLKTE